MNKLFIILILFSFQVGKAQTLKCTEMHTGKFELKHDNSPAVSIIERTDTLQIETNEYLKVKRSYKVIWIDDCTFELHDRKVLEGETPINGKPTDVLTIEIIKIEGQNVHIRLTSNYSDMVRETVMTKIN